MVARRATVVTLLVTLISSLVPPGAVAQESTPASTPEPAPEGYFEAFWSGQDDGLPLWVDLEPGASTELTLVLSNPSPAAFGLRSFTADVFTAPNGGLSMEEAGQPLEPPTTWLTFPTEEVPLEPGQQATRAVTVTVPEDTPSGEYATAIAVETVEDFGIAGSDAFRQRVRKVIPLFIVVPGEMRAEFTLGQPVISTDGRWPYLEIPIENSGNVRLRLEGELRVSDSTGQELISAPLRLGYVYSGDATVIAMPLDPPLPQGDYRIDLQLADPSWEVNGSLEGATFVMPEIVVAQALPFEFTGVTVEPNADPVQFALVSVEVENRQGPVQGATLMLSVFKDGEHVEDFPLDDDVLLQPGATTFQQRYIPLTGFESGTYTFSLTLQSVDTIGATTTLLTQEDVATLEVP